MSDIGHCAKTSVWQPLKGHWEYAMMRHRESGALIRIAFWLPKRDEAQCYGFAELDESLAA